MAIIVTLTALALISLIATCVLSFLDHLAKATLCMWFTATFTGCATGSVFHFGYMLTGYGGTIITLCCIMLTCYMGIELLCNPNRALKRGLTFIYRDS